MKTLPLLLALFISAQMACIENIAPNGTGSNVEPSPNRKPEQLIYNGTPITTTLHWVVTPQVIASGACSAIIYNANWVIGSAACISASRDTNGDGILSGSEIPSGSYIWNGYPSVNYIDLVVKQREATWGSSGGTDLVMYHVTTPFDITWLVNNRGAGQFYTNNTLNLYTSSTTLQVGAILLAYGYGTTTFPNLGYGYPQVAADYGSWLSTQPYNNAGTTCDGDSGGPLFYYDGTKYLWFGLQATYGGYCGASAASVASRYVATWIQHIAGTLQ